MYGNNMRCGRPCCTGTVGWDISGCGGGRPWAAQFATDLVDCFMADSNDESISIAGLKKLLVARCNLSAAQVSQ